VHFRICEPEVHAINLFPSFPVFFKTNPSNSKAFFVGPIRLRKKLRREYKDKGSFEISCSSEFANLMRQNWYATFVPVWAHHKSHSRFKTRERPDRGQSSAAAPGNLAHCRKTTIAGMHIR
jgi:hypothetical protein